MPRRLPLMLLGCVLLWAGAAQSRTVPKPKKVVAGDEQVEAAIRARFARSKIGRNNFTVRVSGGVATLEGETDVVQHKGTATRLAKGSGAARVVNRDRKSVV